MSIEADLNKPLDPIVAGIKAGKALSTIGKDLAQSVSRQRVWQILKEQGLHDLWKEKRLTRRRKERAEAEQEKRIHSTKYQKIVRGVQPYANKGFAVEIEKEGNGYTAIIEGAIVAVHETNMDKIKVDGLKRHDPRLNYFHIRSVKPHAVQILVFSNGSIYTIAPPGADKPTPCSVYIPREEVKCNGQNLFTREQFQKIAKEQKRWIKIKHSTD